MTRGLLTRPAVILGYHDVASSGAEGYTVTATMLRAHLRLLRRCGLRVVPVPEIADRLADGRSVQGLAAVTFDDGLIGVLRHGLPVLLEENVPATVYAVSDHRGAPPPWWPGSARTMTGAELLEVRAAGVRIEAHTRHHPSLPALDPVALVDEVAGCRRELEDLLGEPVRHLAYPFGHHDAEVRQVARDAGFASAATFLNGRLTGVEDPLKLPRFTMTAGHSRLRLLYHLARPAESWPDHQLDQVRDGSPTAGHPAREAP